MTIQSENKIKDSVYIGSYTSVTYYFNQWFSTLKYEKTLSENTKKEMLKDPAVKSVINTKRLCIQSITKEIKAASNNPKDVAIAEDIRMQLENMEGTINDVIHSILSAIYNRHSVSEIIPKIDEQGKIALDRIETRIYDFNNFKIMFDSTGKITHIIQGQKKFDDLERFIIYFHLKEGDRPYGETDLESMYYNWFCKQALLKFRNLYLEKISKMSIIGKLDAEKIKTDKKLIAAIWKAYDDITNSGKAILPEGFEYEIIDIVRKGLSGEFESTIDYYDKQIRLSGLMSNLIQDSGKVGSYNLGVEHVNMFFLILQKYIEDIEEKVFNEKIIKTLVKWRHGPQKIYPKMKMGRLKSDDTLNRARIISILQKSGYKISPIAMLEYTKLPIIESEIEATPGTQSLSNFLSGHNDDVETKRLADPKKIDGINTFGTRRALTKREKESGMKLFSELLTRILVNGIKKSDTAIESAVNDTLNNIKKKKLIENADLKAARDIQINIAKYKNILYRTLIMTYAIGYANVYDYVRKKIEGMKLADKFYDLDFIEDNLSDEKKSESFVAIFVDFMKKHSSLTKSAIQKLSSYLDDTSFVIAGLDKADIEKVIKLELQNAIDDGLSYREFKNNVLKKNIKYSSNIYAGIIKKDEKLKPSHLELVYRNNMMKIFSKSRMEAMNDSDIDDYVQFYVRSDVMDDRERDTHIEAAKYYYYKTDTNNVPPKLNGIFEHNCRCVLIPVIQGEKIPENLIRG